MAIGGGKNMSGLLGKDFNDPRTQGVMGLATGLLAAGAPRVGGAPQSLGGALAQGLQMGQNAFNQAQARQDKMGKGKFQVVGGSLLDLSDPSNPQVVYEQAKQPKTGLLGDGKFTYTQDPDGNISVQKSNAYDDIVALEQQKKTSKSLSTAAQKAEDDDFFAIDTSAGIMSDLDRYTGLIDSGDLSFGAIEGVTDSVMRGLGIAGEEEINSAQFDTFLEKLRNDTLRLNKGVQTEGDAQRALNEIIANKNDTKVVRAQLERLRDLNERAIELRKRNVNRRRKTQGVGSFDFSGYQDPTTSDDVSYEVVK